MKLVNCVISYNRHFYLRNMIESLEEFFPYGDMILIDDQSDNPDTVRYLDALRDGGMPVFSTTTDKSSPLYKGGLYHAMDMGMDYAMDNGYEYVNYLQDDMQCLWYDAHFQERIERMFALSEKVLSVCSFFFKGIKKSWVLKNITLYPEVDGYDRKRLAIPCGSIVSVKRLAKLDHRFADYATEGLANEPLYQAGYFSLTPRLPHFAWIPWPKATTYGATTGTERPPRKKYYYRPISGKRLASFKSRSLTEVPFVEDYCRTWGYLSVQPYWFTQFSAKTYFMKIINNMESGIITFPHF